LFQKDTSAKSIFSLKAPCTVKFAAGSLRPRC
jgi:hypothetical protein